jgi:hypothetical protein
MSNRFKSFKNLVSALAMGVALMATCANAMADKLYLKDGRVLDGTLVRQDSAFVDFSVNGKEEIFDAADVTKVEKTEAAKPAAPAATAAPAAAAPAATEPAKTAAPAASGDSKKEGDDAKSTTGKPTRVAIINFGPPQWWKNQNGLGNVDSLVGGPISVKSWMDILPMLEKAKTDVVVVRVNSGGGMNTECQKFQEMYKNVYKKKFRTVAWIESGISAAAMSPWVLNEIYMMPEGSLGACTSFYGASLVAMKGIPLEQLFEQMRQASLEGGHDPLIMRAMEIEMPLSCNFEENGKVTFFADSTSGSFLVNPDNRVLTLTSTMATKIKLSQGVAATKEELVKVMGLKEVEWVAQDATKYMDDYMLKAHRATKYFIETAAQYILARNAAQQLARTGNDPRFGTELGKARQALAEMKRQVDLNPNFPDMLGQEIGESLDSAWFAEQEAILKRLAQMNREAADNARRQGQGR